MVEGKIQKLQFVFVGKFHVKMGKRNEGNYIDWWVEGSRENYQQSVLGKWQGAKRRP
jgi:hypothetical protein